MQTPFWTIDYVYDHHADDDLHRRILGWADERARALLNTIYGRPIWFANVYTDQTAGFSISTQRGSPRRPM